VTGSAPSSSPAHEPGSGTRLWIERLRLTDFRNYQALGLDLDPRPVVLTGPNGSGKTNLLEAVSLLAPGRGLRRAAFAELVRTGAGESAGWAVAARVDGLNGRAEIGTGFTPETNGTGRQVRIDGVAARGSGVLGEHVRLVWLTPSMDGLFTGPAGERRAFLDRLIQSLDPGYRAILSRFERAMRQRNALLERGAVSPSEYDGLETQMAEAGVALAAARAEAVGRLRAETAAAREAGGEQPFPWATLALEGNLEARLEHEAAIDVEDGYRAVLKRGRERDRAAKRTLDGPHRSDLVVGHGPKEMPARNCSTGEQKALLIGLVLAHSRLVKQASGGLAPLILLDEIAAHLDETRRTALFAEIGRLEAQAWMTGTDAELFSVLGESARFFTVKNGGIAG
jgi:DNA replication and repair protein RecF